MQVDLCADRIPAGRWLRVRYRIALYGSAARPGHSASTSKGRTSQNRSAPHSSGRGMDRARSAGNASNPHCLAGRISPRRTSASTSCEVLTHRELLTLAWKRSALKTIVAVAIDAGGDEASASGLLKDLLGGRGSNAITSGVHEVARTGSGGAEAPRDSWRQGLHIRAIVLADGGDSARRSARPSTRWRGRSYPNWSIAVVGPDGTYPGDRPAVHVEGEAEVRGAWEGPRSIRHRLSDRCRDTIADYAMAALGRVRVEVRPSVSMFCTPTRTRSMPTGDMSRRNSSLDWSPIFHGGQPYVGRAVYLGAVRLRPGPIFRPRRCFGPRPGTHSLPGRRPSSGHIRRVLLTKSRKSTRRMIPLRRPCQCREGQRPRSSFQRATVPILLAACFGWPRENGAADLRAADPRQREQEPATRDLFERARAHAWVKILEAPGRSISPPSVQSRCRTCARAGSRLSQQ